MKSPKNFPLFIFPLFILTIVIIVIVIYISPPAVSCTADATVPVHNSYAAPALDIDRKFARQANNVLSQNETHITS